MDPYVKDRAAGSTDCAAHARDSVLDGDVPQPRQDGCHCDGLAVAAAAPDSDVGLWDGGEAWRHGGTGGGGKEEEASCLGDPDGGVKEIPKGQDDETRL